MATDTTPVEPFVFDWQKEPEGFIKWLLPHLMVGASDSQQEAVCEATEKFTDCQLTVQVNGIEVNAAHFFETIQVFIKASATEHGQRMAAELLQLEKVRDLGGAIYQLMQESEKMIRRELREAMVAAGLDPRFEDEW